MPWMTRERPDCTGYSLPRRLGRQVFMAPLARERGGCTGWRGGIATFEAWGFMPPLSKRGAGCIGEIRRRVTALSVNGEG